VQQQLRKIIANHGKIAATRAKSFLSAFYAWAMKEGLAKTNPTINTQDIAKNDPRTRVLSDNEILAMWSACRADDFGRIVKLLFFTGCRRDEIGGLKWNEVDLDSSVLLIAGSRTKSGRELRLTLPPAAAAILRQAPRRAGRDFLFGERGGAFQRWSWEKMALDKRLVEAGHQFEPWTLHDIRRSVRTRLSSIGIAPHIAELVLNHVGHRRSVDGAVYDQHDYQLEIADALMRWSVALAAIVGPPTESNVTPMRRATA
jgi:integrase